MGKANPTCILECSSRQDAAGRAAAISTKLPNAPVLEAWDMVGYVLGSGPPHSFHSSQTAEACSQ